jgi:hypothetical protein
MNMVTSNDTVQQILNVILRHVDRPTVKRIVEDLMSVSGNKSFRDTIERMYNSLDDVQISRRRRVRK